MLRLPRAPALFLDFDGCLVELAPTPMATRVPRDLMALLGRLHRACGGALAIVSGRPSGDLRHFFKGISLPMVGSHGAEAMRGRGRVAQLPIDADLLATLTEGARAILHDRPGTLLERKPVAVGLHYRRAPQEEARIQAAAEALVARAPGFHTHQSKLLVEIRPDGIGKGDAIAGLMQRPPFRGRVPIAMGDDATDEAGFAVVNQYGGVSVKVGAGPTCARHRLGHPAQVRAALWALVQRLEQR